MEGPDPVKDRQGGARGRGSKAREGDSAEGEGEAEPGEEVVRDPSLGKLVDLSG
jgi:hypothetical protein